MEVIDRRQTVTSDDAVLWFEQYRSSIIGIALVLVTVGLFYGALQLSRSWKENAVAQKLVESTTLDAKLQVATQNLGTDQSALALLLIGSGQNENKDPTSAIKTYQLFLANYPHHTLRNAARLGLAYSEELAGQPDAALKDYIESGNSRPADNYNALALLNAARLYEKKSDLKSARQVLADCSSQFSETIYGRQAAEKLKALPTAK